MKKNWFKYTFTFIMVLALRLIPFRTPNVEPIMAAQMPFGKVYGKLSAFLFGALSIVVYDSLTSGIGMWTVITALAYGLVGLGAGVYFKNRGGWKSYATYAVIATILYDAATGLTLGPLFFGQSLSGALIGQIPFTALHLLGNVSFAIILSPVIETWSAKKREVAVQVLNPVVL
ncbi:MAG: ECF transporter S component [Patescibacteria group bacterium]|nr:ECF transporter S component [Patescibacteria group bacterium]